MARRIPKFIMGIWFIYGAGIANGGVTITITQTPPEPISFASAVDSCNDSWNRITKGDKDLEGVFISRFGSKNAYLRRCSEDLVEADQQKLRFPVKEVYCELEAYQKTIEAYYDQLEGHSIDWKKFRLLTVTYSSSGDCMNKRIPNS
ncbi:MULTISPECIES: hypothetical protein [unclassified Marinobacter]|uniref:hypothetical protein n=1 Tax=unclassified Marinobacter TaxID=83889 RepID=UPI00126856BE|nr:MULTISPECIES: hypothetical protein [unclassified Marinobacter]QFS88424.1 hypothetical protein FIV08_16440 [Marinobacter sp. THAF197a]QFT52209.1 hypothetical protein FIU96_16350 [Marinobacter sp. THAF39]